MLTALPLLGLLLTQQAHAPLERDSVQERRLVFSNLYTLDWSVLSGVPSGQVSVFLGSSLRTRWGRHGRAWKTALGYELSGSAGGADFYTVYYSWGGDYGLMYHRHHLAALGYGARDDRLFYQFAGGLLMWRYQPVALEAEARLGVILNPRSPRLKSMVGGMTRIVSIINGTPLPQFGIFAGFFVF